MLNLAFEWDEWKNRANQVKHSVSFEEAKTVFLDDDALEFYDDEHSEKEDRFLILGLSMRLRLLMVCHCERKVGEVVRIISARRATKREQGFYRGGKK
jgi:uncharacterized protein